MKRLASLVFAFVLAVPMSAYAATTETTKVENKGNPIKVSSNQLSEGVTFSLEKDKPVQVEFPDGQIETFTFKVEDVKNENGSRATSKTKRMAVERGYGTANLELSAYATYSGRSVSIDGDAYLDFWGLNLLMKKKQRLLKELAVETTMQKQVQLVQYQLQNQPQVYFLLRNLILKCGLILQIRIQRL